MLSELNQTERELLALALYSLGVSYAGDGTEKSLRLAACIQALAEKLGLDTAVRRRHADFVAYMAGRDAPRAEPSNPSGECSPLSP
jgi:hypothetical protein